MKKLTYSIDSTNYKSVLHQQDSQKPCVVLYPTWMNLNTLCHQLGEVYTNAGYSVLLVDLYGDQKSLNSREEAQAHMQTLLSNFSFFLKVITKPLEEIKQHYAKIVPIGYCFGGYCTLELAKHNTPVEMVVSIHGLYKNPLGSYQKSPHAKIHPKILFFSGALDPYLPNEDYVQLTQEFKEKEASWKMVTFGQAMHGFTNPAANNPESGVLYNKDAASETHEEILRLLSLQS